MTTQPYTQRITDFNLNGPVDQVVFTTPQQGTYVLRHLVWSPTAASSNLGIYVSSPGGAVLFHLARGKTGDGSTIYIDLRQELRPGESIHVSLPVNGQSANGAITAYALS